MAGGWVWCVTHGRAEPDGGDTNEWLGPYPDRASAEQALDTIHDRNARLDAEDARWRGDPD